MVKQKIKRPVKPIRPEAVNPPAASSPDDPPFPHQRRWLAALMAAVVLSRVILLFMSRRYLMSDEAVVGIMAHDILSGKPIPLFLYGQAYGGGHILEALLMIPGLKLFGLRDWVVTAVPAALGCLNILVVYGLVYRFFSKRLALLSAAFLSFTCTYVVSNFEASGNMITFFFALAGLFFFFNHYYAGRPRPGQLFLAGAALGFGLYCYNFALFHILAAGGLLLYRHRFSPWRGWKDFGLFGGGLLAGASELLVYNFTHNFANFRMLFPPAADPSQALLPGIFRRAWTLVSHDMPSFFSQELNEILYPVPWPAWVSAALFYLALAGLVVILRGPILAGLRGLFRRPPQDAAPRQERILCVFYFFALYGVLYCLSRYGGKSGRYLFPFYPFLSILPAWAVLRLGRARPRWAIAWTVLFLAPQFWFIGAVARDKTTTEWRVTLHAEDIPRVVKFLEERNLTEVLTPYEIKWKLEFYSNRRIACESLIFGFDRETDSTVLDRVNAGKAPLVMVFDEKSRLTAIGDRVSHGRGFNVPAFIEFLNRNGVKCEVTKIGDYVVLQRFSKSFSVYQNFYNKPLVPLGGSWTLD